MTEEPENIKCPNCGKKQFEFVDITWVGAKNAFLYRQGKNIISDFDNCREEVYPDCSENMFIECMGCEKTYTINTDEHGMEKLLSIDVKELRIKDQPALKKIELVTWETKLKNKEKEFKRLTSNIEKLKEKEKVLQRRVEAGRMATEGEDLRNISRIIKRKA